MLNQLVDWVSGFQFNWLADLLTGWLVVSSFASLPADWVGGSVGQLVVYSFG